MLPDDHFQLRALMPAGTGPRLLTLLASSALPRLLTIPSSSPTDRTILLLVVARNPVLGILQQGSGRDSGEVLLDFFGSVHVREARLVMNLALCVDTECGQRVNVSHVVILTTVVPVWPQQWRRLCPSSSVFATE